MCFGGQQGYESSQAPVSTSAPKLSPAPSASPSAEQATESQSARRRQLAAIRSGRISTILAGRGITGQGAELNNQTSGNKLGS